MKQYFQLSRAPSQFQICTSDPNDDNASHHVRALHESNHPFVICTDDKGVFNCPLSSEYLRAKNMLRLSDRVIVELAKRGFDFAFASEDEKLGFERLWKEFEEKQFKEKL